MKKWIINKWTLLLVVLIAIVAAFLILRNNNNSTATKYVTETAAKGLMTVTVTGSGNVSALTTQVANFSEQGTLTALNVKVGDTVTAGEQLATIDPTTYQTQLSQDQVSLAQANNNLKFNLESLQQTINGDQITLTKDQTSLANYTLYSSYSGTIKSINNNVGDTVGSSATQGSQGSSGSAFVVITDTGGVDHNVNFLISGTISQIDVSVGQSIFSGQLLGKLDTSSINNQITLDQIKLSQDNANYPVQQASLENAITSAQQKIQTDQTNITNTALKSNINGTVYAVNGTVGSTVSASGNSAAASSSSSTSSGIVSIYDPTSLAVNLAVDETDISKVKVGQIAQLTFTALGTTTYLGTVSAVSLTGSNSSGVVNYTVTITINKPDSKLKIGMSAAATVIIQTIENVISVPTSAVQTNASGQETVQILKNNSPKTVVVTTGISNDSDTEITGGINVGDVVIESTVTSGTTSTTRTSTSLFGGTGATGAATRSFGGGGFGGGL